MHERKLKTERHGKFTAKQLTEAVVAAGAVAGKVIESSRVLTAPWVRL